MPKTKTPVKKTPARKPVARESSKTKSPATPRKPAPAKKYTAEYADYLDRHAGDTEGRPRLSPGEFDRLDDELLELLDLQTEGGLDDEQIIRIEELKYLLLESE